MIDASVAEKCKTHPHLASDLQTLCWASFGLGKIASAGSTGLLYDVPWIGSRGLFGLTMLTSLAMLVPALSGWLGELPRAPKLLGGQPGGGDRGGGDPDDREQLEDLATGARRMRRMGPLAKLQAAFADPLSGPVYRLSVVVLAVSTSMGAYAQHSTEDGRIFAASLAVAATLAAAVFFFERRISLRLAKASVYIFLSGAMQPSSTVLFLWLKRDPDFCGDNAGACAGAYCPRPCFSPEFLSGMSVLAYVVFVLGTAVYNRYLSTWSYRRIWGTTQVLLALTGMLDLVLVNRWNLAVGIPDKAFIVGDEIAGDLVQRLSTMPLFVLAAATCPSGVEATLFALGMGLSNFGATLGQYNGVGLLWALGGVAGPEFDGLHSYVVLRSLSRLLPLLLIPLFVPAGSPSTEADANSDDDDVRAGAGAGAGADTHSTDNSASADDARAEDEQPLVPRLSEA